MNLAPNDETSLPLQSTFAENLAILSALNEACLILDDPDSDALSMIQASNTINLLLNALMLPEE